VPINGWRVMWLIAVYDCPVTTQEQRTAYSRFRRCLLEQNFIQHQFSVYARHFPTMSAAEAMIKRLQPAIPEGAHVAFFLLTDKQYGMTKEFFGVISTRKKPSEPAQIELF
jgi:CRISPR-associated protein Cas2